MERQNPGQEAEDNESLPSISALIDWYMESHVCICTTKVVVGCMHNSHIASILSNSGKRSCKVKTAK